MYFVQSVKTNDNSYTLYVPELNEHYHSTFGAVQESMCVYIKNGLQFYLMRHPKIQKINIFEMGFGTGLNAFLTWLNTKKSCLNVEYTAIEKFPLDISIIELLYVGEFYNDIFLSEKFKQFHISEWNKPVNINHLILKKINVDVLDYIPDEKFDLVYFDAFAPDIQPEIWSKEVFEKLYNSMNPNGLLTTYSAKGTVRRLLLETGFNVEKLKGPTGKRHVLRASIAKK